MAKFSLAFPLKRILSIAVFIICLLIILQLYLSLFLSRYTFKIINNIDESLGKVYISATTYDIVNGIVLHNVAIVDNSTPPQLLFQAKKLAFNFYPFDIFLKELNFNRLKCRNAAVYLETDVQTFSKLSKISEAAYREFLKYQIIPLEINIRNPTIIVKGARLIFVERSIPGEALWVAKLNGRTIVRSDEIFSQGKFNIECKFSKDSSFFNFLEGGLLNQSLDFEVMANLGDNDVVIERFDLSLGYDHITGFALVKNFQSKIPSLNIIINSSNLSIENISSLVDDFDTRGTFNISANIRGPIDDLRFMLALNFLGCSFRYPPLPLMRNIVGKIYCTNKGLKADNIFFIANEIPLKVNSEISRKKDIMKLTLDVAIKHPSKVFAFLPRSIKTAVLWREKKDSLLGKAEVIFRATDDNLYSLQLEDFKFFTTRGEGMLRIKKIIFTDRTNLGDSPPEEKKLNFSNFCANFDFKKEGIKIKDIRLSGFEGEIVGDFNLDTSAPSKYKLQLHADGFNASQIQDSLNLPYNLLGDISAKLFVHSGDKFCDGVLLIKNGKLQETAVLLGLSEYMRINSLKAIDFDKMQLNFSFLKEGIYRYGLRSWGKDAILKANIHIDRDRQLSGYFEAQLSQQILGESRQFRRLLKIIGDTSGFIEFSFTLKGTIHTPRLSWLRNDFKRSLERVIPSWYRRGMQRDIDSVVEEMFEE